MESTIKDKLNQLPRPEPQHPHPVGLPIVSSPTLPPQLSSLPSQGFGSGTLPPLPAFAFPPQCPFPGPLYPPPLSVPDNLPSRPTVSENERKSASPKGERTDIGVTATVAKVKQEVVTPPASPRQLQQVQIKQEPQDNENVVPESQRGINNPLTSGHIGDTNYPSRSSFERVISKDPFEIVTPKQPFESVISKQPPELITPKEPCELVTPKEPFSLVTQKQPYDLVTQKESTESLTQRGPFDLVTQKEQFESSLSHRKPFESVTQKEPFDLVTPKLEPVQSNPLSVSDANTSQTETESINSTVTSQAEVKSEGQGDKPDIEIMEEESDSDREGTLTPGPVPTPCNKEIHRSKSAM